MKTTLLNLLAAILLLLPAVHSEARFRAVHSGGPARTELQAYMQQNVLPIVRQQRQKLDAKLSAADQTQLATYRTQLQTFRRQAQALRQATRPAAGASRPSLTPAQQEQRQQLRAATKAVLLNVSQLARKYEADIRQLTQELQPQQQKWQADLAAIRARHADTVTLSRARRGGAASHLLRPVRFLLLAPAAVSVAPPSDAASLYPNPAVATSQLTYTVQKPGPVTIELLDGRGNTLRTLAQESRQEKGPHTVSINLSELPAGIYFYKISTRTGAETRRFLKE